MIHTHNQTLRDRRLKNEYRQWLQDGDWTYFVTLASNESSRSLKSSKPLPVSSQSRTQFMLDRLEEWEARINHKFLGKKWQLKSKERLVAIAVIEKVHSNPHWHLIIRDQFRRPEKDFSQIAEDVWAKLIKLGSVNVQPITSMKNLSHYLLKSNPHLRSQDQLFFLPSLSHRAG